MSEYRAAVGVAPAGAVLRVRVLPRARANRVDGVHGDAAKVRVTAPATGGRANAAALAVLAAALDVRRRDLEIVRGARARDKTVRITGLDPSTVEARLGRAASD